MKLKVLQDNLVHFLDFEVLKVILTSLHKVLLVFVFLQKCKLFNIFLKFLDVKNWQNKSCSVIHACFIVFDLITEITQTFRRSIFLPFCPYFRGRLTLPIFYVFFWGEGARFIASLRQGFAEIVKDCMASSSRNLVVYLKKEINHFL